MAKRIFPLIINLISGRITILWIQTPHVETYSTEFLFATLTVDNFAIDYEFIPITLFEIVGDCIMCEQKYDKKKFQLFPYAR